MQFWKNIGKRPRFRKVVRGVSRAIVEKATREELCDEIYEAARGEMGGVVDRFGIWLAPEGEEAGGPQAFRGRFWELNEEVATEELPEWSVLGKVGLLPEELLSRLEPVEREISEGSELPLAAASGTRRVLWVPVCVEGELLGVLFAATRHKAEMLPREALMQIAAELAAGLGFQERGIRVGDGLAEQVFQKKILEELRGPFSLHRVLQEIVDASLNCGTQRKPIGPFVMIGLQPAPAFARGMKDSALEFHWTAGDRLWARSAMSEPISSLWREAVKSGRTTGGETRAPWSPQESVRLIAVPVGAAGRAAGVFVAGLRQPMANLATLERLEGRARLASLAVELSHRHATVANSGESVRFFLDHAADAWFLLNAKLEVTHTTKAGRKLLQAAPAASRGPGNETRRSHESFGTAAQLFRPTEWQRLVEWLRGVSQNDEGGAANSRDCELRTGRQVRVYAAPLAAGITSLLIQGPAENDNAESRAKAELNGLIEWVDEGVLIFGEDNEIRAANAPFSQFFGLSAAEMNAAPSLRELIGFVAPRVSEPDRLAEQWWDTARSLDSGGREEIQVKQPTPRLIERLTRPVRNSAGARIGRVEIYRDLTSQRTLQSKLRKNEQLVSLGERMSGIAHELSNPLTTILGYAQRLLSKPERSPRRADVERIFSEAERASSILRQLLGSIGESTPELQPLHLNALIQSTVDQHRFQLASEKIRCDLDLAPAIPQILGDPGQLQQVLLNLISNSRHALLEQQRPGVISIRTGRSDSGRVWLEFSDNGPGIPEALRHRIFDPFFTTKPAGIGTGLGLSIVASLVRQHGGLIRLTQTGSSGASFLLDFPAAPAHSALSLSDQPPTFPMFSRTGRGEKVLVVEDEQTVAELIADMLADLGYASEIQRDARRALISALNRDFALVICDIKMPGLDGPHFYRALAEAGSALISRFVFVTGDVLGTATREFLQENRLPYIAKPFRIEEFTEKIALAAEASAASAGMSGQNPVLSRKNYAGHG